jgi:hypothetical protein
VETYTVIRNTKKNFRRETNCQQLVKSYSILRVKNCLNWESHPKLNCAIHGVAEVGPSTSRAGGVRAIQEGQLRGTSPENVLPVALLVQEVGWDDPENADSEPAPLVEPPIVPLDLELEIFRRKTPPRDVEGA